MCRRIIRILCTTLASRSVVIIIHLSCVLNQSFIFSSILVDFLGTGKKPYVQKRMDRGLPVVYEVCRTKRGPTSHITSPQPFSQNQHRVQEKLPTNKQSMMASQKSLESVELGDAVGKEKVLSHAESKLHHHSDPFAPRDGKTLLWKNVNMKLVSSVTS